MGERGDARRRGVDHGHAELAGISAGRCIEEERAANAAQGLMLTGDLITYWRVLPVYFWVLATAARESSD